jgi:GNAT superfamily N-acetyltransferase
MIIRPLQWQELSQADAVFRLAFGTAANLSDPLQMFGDAGYMHRWYLPTGCAIAAEHNGKIVGTNFLARWGSLGLFGPLTVHPDYWNQGIASKLMSATIAQFDQWQTPALTFFTSSHSAKHLWFYSKFGFSPGYLTTVLAKTVTSSFSEQPACLYSTLAPQQQEESLSACQTLTDTIYSGLDLRPEIQLVAQQQLGETLLLGDEVGLAAFAICHYGAGSEGGSNHCYIKFGAVRPGSQAETRFEQLLAACYTFAADRQLNTLTAGVNTSRHRAYWRMLAQGFKIRLIGVAMHQAPRQDYCRPDVYALDDRR